MKRTTLSMVLVMLSTLLFAQEKNSSIKKIYLEIGTGPSNHNGAMAQLGATVVFKNNWTASLSFYNFDMDPKGLPSDYEAGYLEAWIVQLPDVWPSIQMNLVNFTGGKIFQLGRKTWITTEAGISIVSGEKMTFTPQAVTTSGLYTCSNYSSDKQSQSGIGGIVKADFNWAFTPYLGLGVGAFAAVNAVQSPVGAQIKLIVGWLNTKRKK
jgi:hypothetical protein